MSRNLSGEQSSSHCPVQCIYLLHDCWHQCKVLGKSTLYTKFWVKFLGFWVLGFLGASLRRTGLNSDSESGMDRAGLGPGQSRSRAGQGSNLLIPEPGPTSNHVICARPRPARAQGNFGPTRPTWIYVWPEARPGRPI